MTVRRMKTYTGGQAYVYQYYFVGKRPALPNESFAPANEYVFDVTTDRKTTFAISVFLPEEVIGAWAESHGRVLTEAEQYATVKMRLFQAFDEVEDFAGHSCRLLLDAALLESLLAVLGRD